MARKFKKSKVSICVFCEGESEQAYTDFLKSEFHDVAVFKRPSSPGLFDDADNRFKKDPKIRVRLLMTTGCIEYWLMLHYRHLAPSLLTVPDKERMLAQVVNMEPTYRKGNYDATARIAQNYPTAVKNATIVLQNLLQEGMPGLEDTDERNRWLCTKCKTFSTVQEAIVFLEGLQS